MLPHMTRAGLYVLVIGLLFAAQFGPLIVTLNLVESQLQDSIRSSDAKVAAGFGMGVLVLVLADLIADFAMGDRSLLWLSRTGYFWLPFIKCSLILFFSDITRIAAVYTTFSSAAMVFYYGRASLDLCRFDTTETWTYSKSALLLLTLALGYLCINVDLHYADSGQHIVGYVGLGLICLYQFCLIINPFTCLLRLSRKHSSPYLAGRLHLLTHEETIAASISLVLCVSTIALLVLPAVTLNRSVSIGDMDSKNIIGDILIRSFLICALSLLPSLLLKHKAQFLQQDLDMKSLFVRNVSHEIRTPLNIAVAGLDILHRTCSKRSSHGDSDELEMLEEIMDSCKVAVTILDDLLSYEKISTGALQLERAHVKVAKIVRQAAALFRIQARGKDISLKVLDNDDVINEFTEVEVDAGKITQVLRNFISNAIKFTPEGGVVQVRAFQRSRSKRSEAVIQVVDSGVGMTPAQLERIFSEVVQYNVNELQGGGGSGIGLWYAIIFCIDFISYS